MDSGTQNQQHITMRMITDLRSEKVKELTAFPDRNTAELLWWFQKSSEQYRIRGNVELVGDEVKIGAFVQEVLEDGQLQEERVATCVAPAGLSLTLAGAIGDRSAFEASDSPLGVLMLNCATSAGSSLTLASAIGGRSTSEAGDSPLGALILIACAGVAIAAEGADLLWNSLPSACTSCKTSS